MSLFKAITGLNTGTSRQSRDFYPSTDECVGALMRVEFEHIIVLGGGPIWEPACGDGGISKPLRARGFETIDTDLLDGRFGTRGVDFLDTRTPLARKIITNPPFGISERFIKHAWRMFERGEIDYLALLLKATYWHAGKKMWLFDAFEPAAVYPLGWRVDFTGGGASPMDMSWYVWRRHTPGVTAYRPLARPIKEAA